MRAQTYVSSSSGSLSYHIETPPSNMSESLIRQSHLGFLQVPTHKQSPINRGFNLTDEIFLRGLNKSYIGQISGQTKPIKEIDIDELLAQVDEEEQEQERGQQEKPARKRKRINFSSIKNVPSDRRIQLTESRMMPSRNGSRNQLQDEIVELDGDTFILVSFEGKDKKDLLPTGGCMFCESGGKQRCQLKMQNESTLEIYIAGESGRKTQFDKLFLSVNFDTVEVELEYQFILNDKQIALVMKQYRLLLEHQKVEVVEEWYDQLKLMHQQGKGTEFHLTRLLELDGFYNRRYETEHFFTENCQTGDILLFQDTHFLAKAQRFFTRSDFDHVAVAIRDSAYGLLMFESMSGGVALTPWKSVILHGWFNSIPRITWRRLTADRDNHFNDVVQKFVKENIEKSYQISITKLMSNVSMLHGQPEAMTQNKGSNGQNKKKEPGYFCSELVAYLYKELGLLTRDVNSANYQPACKFLPKDFTVRSGRQLDAGELSPEYDIFFDRQLLKKNYKNIKF